MKYTCDRCNSQFRMGEYPTLDDLQQNRVLYHDDSYWHIPCATITRDQLNMFVLDPNSKGKLIAQ